MQRSLQHGQKQRARQIDKWIGLQTHTRACTNTYNHTHRSTQTYNHIDILERKLRVHTLIQRQTDQILSPCLFATKQRAEGGAECGGMLQQMAHLLLLILLLSSSHSCATCGGGHTLSETVRPPRKSRMQVIYNERSRSPQIKVCCASAWFFLCSRGSCTSLRTCQTE